MREIKFRAWSPSKRCWRTDWSISEYGEVLNLNAERIDPDLILVEYTGLKDKNGKEIYEGDMVEYIDKGRLMESGVYQVVYKDGAFRPICELYHPAWPKEWSAGKTCKVIGNIYENPELLGELEDKGLKAALAKKAAALGMSLDLKIESMKAEFPNAQEPHVWKLLGLLDEMGRPLYNIRSAMKKSHGDQTAFLKRIPEKK